MKPSDLYVNHSSQERKTDCIVFYINAMDAPIRIDTTRGRVSVNLVLPEFIASMRKSVLSLKEFSPWSLLHDMRSINKNLNDLMYRFRLFENVAHQISNIDDSSVVEQYVNTLFSE